MHRIWLLSSAVVLLLLTACSKGELAVDQANRDGVLLFGNSAEPRDLDPHVVTGLPEHRIIKSVLEGLVTEHPSENGVVLSGMAERWESSDQTRVWTFYLREALWSNGDAVTANDFVYAYQRILNPEFGAPYASMLFVIENAEAYNEGKVDSFDKVGVKAIDDRTIEFTLKGPTPFFPTMLTHYTYFPLHQPTIEKFDAFAQRGTGWTQPENFVGNGPFQLVEWLPNQRISVEKRSSYWDVDNVGLNMIRFYPISDRQTESRMFETGLLHRTSGVPFNQRDTYRADERGVLREESIFATNYMGLNTTHEALSDPRVRRALAHAIDEATIINNVTKNGQPAFAFVPPGIDGYSTKPYFEYNPEKARALLAEAGYPDGKGFPSLDYIIPNSDTSRIYAEVVQSMWKDNLGIDVIISNMEWQVLISRMDNGNFDVFQIAWIGDFLDPIAFLKIMKTGDGNNRTGFSDPEYDRLLELASVQTSLEKRYEYLALAEARLMAAMPIIPSSWSQNLTLVHPAVKNWHLKLLMNQPYKSVRLEAVVE